MEIFGAALPIGSKNGNVTQTLKIAFLFIYLNAGSGKPWAGHTSAIEEDWVCTNVELLSAVENFGLALPIGSKSCNVKIIIIFCKHYLNDGTGAPCAGHNNDTMSFSLLTKRLSLASEENLGAAPPIGSMKKSIKRKSQ